MNKETRLKTIEDKIHAYDGHKRVGRLDLAEQPKQVVVDLCINNETFEYWHKRYSR